ncbi:PREDICTED: activated RNA polymerase II transcriptional coactivator p15 [Cyphomyrmex costatus]|uniref:Activated RNA polymerase II transcriptional coactivator p15 n=1 Tax=Cyphomyrmex costatus TaxID=456900 RepID=A0A195CYJ9_9HYME|nr:PREDICTED: activated RNA polymerase II transcriptional coactivator p15 [Cyphomyrmex costatus]KYN05652.1 Activated RNA polymerase II transcriptional coactivator p15 [Cyphomyrmex costatus]
MPKSKEYLSDSDDSSEEEVKSKKKQKREREDDNKMTKDEKKPAKKAKTEDETVWDLGNNRQVNVRNFKGKYYVDIREMYYDKDGDLKPGKKGIFLTMQQWQKFMDVVEEVDKVAKSKS